MRPHNNAILKIFCKEITECLNKLSFKAEDSTNLIDPANTPRSKSLLIKFPGLDAINKGVPVLMLGKDHINPLIHNCFLHKVELNFLVKSTLTPSLVKIKKIILSFKFIGLDLSAETGNSVKESNAPAIIAGAIKILILMISGVSSSDLNITCSFLLEFTIPMYINRAL
jgi:hypothetical protein